MQIEQIYTGCLAQGAYYIVSGNEAAIIDPLREIAPYLARLQRDNVQLKYIFETHFHADFVSGHLDLAAATGAPIVYGATANPDFAAIIAQHAQVFKLGNCTIKALHTPGHTPESTCYLLQAENGAPTAVFTGDTLFIGDVGRPDLAQKAADTTQEELAATLFHSLRTQLMTLPDEVVVYPAHGAGSACGKNMSKETTSTIGVQKATNYALRQDMTEAEFVREVTDGLLPPPAYFPQNVAMNKRGYAPFETLLAQGLQRLAPNDFAAAAAEYNAVILDTRPADIFSKGSLQGAINIGLDGQFAPWVGSLIADTKQPILLVTADDTAEESVTRLARVGFDTILGVLAGGFVAWQTAQLPVTTVHRISPEAFAAIYTQNPNLQLYDMRRETEYAAAHFAQASNKPLDYINDWSGDLDKHMPFFIHCAGGYRSMIAASILQARGFHNFTEVSGGFAKMQLAVDSIQYSVSSEQ
jgi:hydroxyacylglutathione hydrolase